MMCLPGDTDVSDLLMAFIIDQGQPKVLQWHLHFLFELLKLLGLPSFRHHGNILCKQQHSLTPVQEGYPVDLRQAVMWKLTHLILKHQPEEKNIEAGSITDLSATLFCLIPYVQSDFVKLFTAS